MTAEGGHRGRMVHGHPDAFFRPTPHSRINISHVPWEVRLTVKTGAFPNKTPTASRVSLPHSLCLSVFPALPPFSPFPTPLPAQLRQKTFLLGTTKNGRVMAYTQQRHDSQERGAMGRASGIYTHRKENQGCW